MCEVRFGNEVVMTTIRETEAMVFDAPAKRDKAGNVTAKPDRRRVDAIYCPRCAGWVEVRLLPVRLRCTRRGVEASP